MTGTPTVLMDAEPIAQSTLGILALEALPQAKIHAPRYVEMA
jgi:hypothetical protein